MQLLVHLSKHNNPCGSSRNHPLDKVTGLWQAHFPAWWLPQSLPRQEAAQDLKTGELNRFPLKTCSLFGGWKNLTDPLLLLRIHWKPTAWWMEKESPKLHKNFYLFLLVMHMQKILMLHHNHNKTFLPPSLHNKVAQGGRFQTSDLGQSSNTPAMPPKVPAKLGLCSGIINHHDPLMIP